MTSFGHFEGAIGLKDQLHVLLYWYVLILKDDKDG